MSDKVFNPKEVAEHASVESAWVIVDNGVYDVTDFLAEHPGGKKILLKNCGKDSSEFFWQFHNKKILNKVAAPMKIGTPDLAAQQQRMMAMLVILILALAAHSLSVLGNPEVQVPFTAADSSEINFPDLYQYRIFNAIHHAARRWGTSFEPKAASVFPVRLPAGTTLYHARNDNVTHIPSPEWFALDFEMSYMILGRFEGSVMRTYRTTRGINRLLAFDGTSQGWIPGGLDLQDLLSFGYINGSGVPGTDFIRAKLLCDWAKPLGVEGFVRSVSTHEIILCDVDAAPMTLVDTTTLRKDGLQTVGRALLEIIRAGTWNNYGDMRLQMDLSRLVTAHGRASVDLGPRWNQSGRVADLTKDQWRGMKRDIQAMASMGWNHEEVDYQRITHAIVWQFAERLLEIRQFLESGIPGDVFKARKLAQYILYTYTTGHSSNATGVESRCTEHYLKRFDGSNKVVETALRNVVSSICQVLLSLDLRNIKMLMHKLQWTAWEDCDRLCKVGEVCAALPEGGRDYTNARCLGIEDLEA